MPTTWPPISPPCGRPLCPKLGKLPDFSLANANALYRQTLGPVEAQLAGVDHLTVAASGDLASLPFSLLVTAAPAEPA